MLELTLRGQPTYQNTTFALFVHDTFAIRDCCRVCTASVGRAYSKLQTERLKIVLAAVQCAARQLSCPADQQLSCPKMRHGVLTMTSLQVVFLAD